MIVGNFKMNLTTFAAEQALVHSLNEAKLKQSVEVVISPPFIYMHPVKETLHNGIRIAAQNCYVKDCGAFTGETSPAQLKDLGIAYVILGHFERRTVFNETPELVAQKIKAALADDLSVILCIGETPAQHEAGETAAVCAAQLQAVVDVLVEADWKRIVIAYDIGNGKVLTPQQAQDTHAEIRAFVSKAVSSRVAQDTRIIYGGGINKGNCVEFAAQSDIDGLLVGACALKPEFVEIINAAAPK
ncbi:triose phosphate isomerase [Mycena rebaudengoi]|nr:triose phosphate isomerase [Mycena rebaudengoi]